MLTPKLIPTEQLEKATVGKQGTSHIREGDHPTDPPDEFSPGTTDAQKEKFYEDMRRKYPVKQPDVKQPEQKMEKSAWKNKKVPTARGRKQRQGYSNIGQHAGRQGLAHGYTEQMELMGTNRPSIKGIKSMEKGATPMATQEQQRLDNTAVQLEKIFGFRDRKKRKPELGDAGVTPSWRKKWRAAQEDEDRVTRQRGAVKEGAKRGLGALARGARGAVSGAGKAARATGKGAKEFGEGFASVYGGGKRRGSAAADVLATGRTRNIKPTFSNQGGPSTGMPTRSPARQSTGAPQTPAPKGEAPGKAVTRGPAYKPKDPAGDRRRAMAGLSMSKAMISLQKYVDDCGCD